MRSHSGHRGKKTWMSRSEVARLLEVAPVTVGRWASEGKLPYAMTLGGRRRFRRAEVLSLVKRLATPVPTGAAPERSERAAARLPKGRRGNDTA
jgi:excisionase family DNA binding protein